MNRPIVAAALILAAGAVSQAQERFDGQRAVRVKVTTARELMTVRNLAEDILTCEGSGIGAFDIRVKPEQYAALIEAGIQHTILIPDIQAHMDQIWADDARVRAGDDPSWFATYRTLTEFEARMQFYATNYPALATLSNIGTSVQGRQIKMLRVTGPGSTANRPAFVIQANQHAREWVTPHTAMYIVDRFCETYGTDPRITNIVNNIDFHIIVTVNPDGYAYSNPSNPSWRKNRRPNSNNPNGGSCNSSFGVDLNRNWGFQWGHDNTGSSGSCTSETYRGVGPFSEPELAGIKTLVDNLAAQGRFKVHWDIHANAQMILSPWGYTVSPAPGQLSLMNTLGQIIHDGMRTVRNTDYPFGQGSVILYLNNGNTRDYSYGVHGAMAWTIEMGGNSFQPAVSQILPLCQEAFAGLLPLAEFYIPQTPPCYANCDGSTTAPVLTANDFSCFLNAFANNQTYANCDESSAAPVLTPNDFACFLNKFAAGCT